MKTFKILIKSIFISQGIAGTIHFSLLIIDGILNRSIEKLNLFKILQLNLFWDIPFINNQLLGFISIGVYYLIITTIFILINQKKVSE